MNQYDFEGNDMNSQGNGNQKKNSGKGLIIVLAAVLSVLVIASGALLVHEIVSSGKSGSDSDPATRVTLAENDHSKDTGATKTNETETKSPADAVYNDSSEIRKTETKAQTYVIDVSEVVENVMPSVVSIVDQLEVTQTYNPFN